MSDARVRGQQRPQQGADEAASSGLVIDHVDVSYGAALAVEDASLSVSPGSVLGIVGESGSGKSTLANAIMSALPPGGKVTRGHLVYNGLRLESMTERDLRALRWTEIAMVFQNALEALNPVFSIGNQLEDVLRRRGGFGKSEARKRAADALARVGLTERWLKAYPHELSGGMRQRVMIALALACNPKLVLADEPTTALDVVAREGIIDLLQELRRDEGMTLVVISHDLGLITRLCDYIAVMYAGQVVEYGPSSRILGTPKHPYTQALIAAYPQVSGPLEAITPLEGDPPTLGRMPSGCRFHPRCARAFAPCPTVEPARRGSPEHWSMCHLESGGDLL